ncbi:MAG: IS481 family transposase [Sterolibacterium sp.]|nr:IS481 family transposase [Sterolibacterium sp.]
MPWITRDLMTLRREFIELAFQESANRRELCRRFGISPKTGYALLARYAVEGSAALQVRSRRPLSSPTRTSEEMEAAVLALRREHPAWGGRKISRRLTDLGYQGAPAPSTVTTILHRHGLINSQASEASTPWQRFEHGQPNELWQIDFKGHFDTPVGRCHSLTLLDDHSRFNLTLSACARTDTPTVQQHLTSVFRRYGLPVRINGDNGPPWGCPSQPRNEITTLTIWLIRLGIRISHSRPFHPQTNGKDERFHRTLQAEVLAGRAFSDLLHVQSAFDHWREIYNHVRPHEAIGLDTPIRRYRASERTYPECLPEIEYSPDDHVVTVGWDGKVVFKGRRFRVSNALLKMPIAFRSVPEQDGLYRAYFCHHRILEVDLRLPPLSV